MKLSDGRSVTFEEYTEIYRTTGERPMVASWDSTKGEVVFQRPLALLVHPNSEHERMIDLQCKYSDGRRLERPLEVTDKHEMLTGFIAGNPWLKVAYLHSAASLVTTGGLCTYDYDQTKDGKTQKTVYNLSMSGIHNFLVSSDRRNWLVAHNLIKKS